ncbi:MAG: DUF1963 domain-containing protein [bacterium]|nr:DUF1963 domain-containing protein [bacterium]
MFFNEVSEIERALDRSEDGAVRERLVRLARPAVIFKEASHPTGCWAFGSPMVPDGFEWPQYEGGPLSFTAQVALSELPPGSFGSADLASGHLLFFGGVSLVEGPWRSERDGDPLARVIYLPAGTTLVPPNLPVFDDEQLLDDQQWLSPAAAFSLPTSWEVVSEIESELGEGTFPADRLAAASIAGISHHMLGWSRPWQSMPERAAAEAAGDSREWTLMMQVDDGFGSAYFVVPKTDRRATSFDQVQWSWDCS